jgi:tRNA(fMet)-specific endonuclease VapC
MNVTLAIVHRSAPVKVSHPAHLEWIMSVIDVMDYTPATAAHHGRLLAYARKSGAQRGAHDLIIAAHAAETGRTVVSRDANAWFGDLPGVAAISA